MRRYPILIIALALLAAAFTVRAAYPASVWAFDQPEDLVANGAAAQPILLDWTSGSWSPAKPELACGFLVTYPDSVSPLRLYVLDADASLIGVYADSQRSGPLDSKRWLMSPSAGTVRLTVQVANALSDMAISSVEVSPSPDANYDGSVNIFDVNLVSSNWGTAGPVGDVNGDGSVGIHDANLIAASWNVAVVDEPETVALVVSGLACLVPVLRRLGAG